MHELDVDVIVGEDGNNFVSLRPSGSWTHVIRNEVLNNVRPGERCKVAFKGATVDWRVWGNKQDQ